MHKFSSTQFLLIAILYIIFIGCKVNPKPTATTRNEFNHNGQKREYIYYSPANLEKGAPLVLVFHGYTSSAETIMDYSRFTNLADEKNFALVFPQGTVDNKSNAFWNVGYTFHKDQFVDDVDFILSLVRHLQKEKELSKSNTFVTGMSNGGEMSYLLACRYPSVFKAAAPVAGMMLDSFIKNCDTSGSVPVFAVFGTDDDVTRFDGDPDNKDGWGSYISIPATIKYWANRTHYNTHTIDTLPDINIADSSYIVHERYLNSEDKKEVRFYKVIHGGHDWPGSWGNMDVDVSKEIWKFFERYKD